MAVTAPYLCAGLSDPGRKRGKNEDRFHADPDRGIFFVIDGVGGQNAGEKAADTALHLIRSRLERQIGDVEDRIRESIAVANNEIFQLAQTNPQWDGMACVLTVAVLNDGEITVGQVGDSRLYLIERGQIRKLTHDHSPVGEREDRGEIDEMTAMRHPRRNEVYRDVGSAEHSPEDPDFIEISTWAFPPEAALLLCSDGLSDLVSGQQILSTIEANAKDLRKAAKELVNAANDAGGKDNITVVLVAGPQFGASFAARSSPRVPETSVARSRPFAWVTAIAFLLLGMLLSGAAVFAIKPYWRETSDGTIFGFGAVREPRTIRVNEDLNAAIASARPGDTVLVPAGVYRENIQMKEGVRIQAERPRESVIAGSGIAIRADDIRSGRLDGFRIVPGEQATLETCIRIGNSSVDIVDNECTGATLAAMELLGSSTGMLRANHIYSNSGSGIVVDGSASSRLVHNVVSGNGKIGIEVRPGASPELIGNTILRNGEDLVTPPQMNRDLILRQNFLGTSETPAPKPRGRAAGRG